MINPECVFDTMDRDTTPHGLLHNDPRSANEEVAKLRLQLNHLSLSELESKGLVHWNRDEGIVTKGPQFGKIKLR